MNLVPARIVAMDGTLMVRLGDRLNLPIPPKEGVTVPAETDVIMGLRTEDFSIDNGDYPDNWKVTGTVDVVEPLGGETHMHVDFQGVMFIAKSEGHRVFQAGEKLRMAMNLNHLHLFDADTTHAIY
jgi:multiple sugar transport system ATP-binding protein